MKIRTMKSALKECWEDGYTKLVLNLHLMRLEGSEHQENSGSGCCIWFTADVEYDSFLARIPCIYGKPILTLHLDPVAVDMHFDWYDRKSDYYLRGSAEWFKYEIMSWFGSSFIPRINQIQVTSLAFIAEPKRQAAENKKPWLYENRTDVRNLADYLKMHRPPPILVWKKDICPDIIKRYELSVKMKKEKKTMNFGQLTTNYPLGKQFRLPSWSEEHYIYARRDSHGEIEWFDEDGDFYEPGIQELIQDCWEVSDAKNLFACLSTADALERLHHKKVSKIWLECTEWQVNYGHLYLDSFGKLRAEKGVSPDTASQALMKGTMSGIKWTAQA